MHRRWIIFGWILLLTALLSVGCSLIDTSDPGTADTSEPGPGSEEATGGTIIINVETAPAGQAGTFQFTGVPTGTLTTESTLVVSDLAPGTYTTTEVDPAPDFDVTAVSCDDSASGTASSGDPQTRTAVINVDSGETVRCTFTNTQRGTLVVATQTEPDSATGQFLFTGVPTGTVSANGTLVVANLEPGTYTTTEADPAPRFDLTAVSCDDGGSASPSSGDPSSRTVIFNLDPGELVRCVFVNTRRGTVIVVPEVLSGDETGSFTYTGVPSGTVSSGGELVVTDLTPGTYTSTEVDPAPDFELTDVACDDGEGGIASSGDAATRSAIFNVDPGETVRCTFSHESVAGDIGTGGGSGADEGTNSDGEATTVEGVNPFDNREEYLTDFPLPDDLPSGAGSYRAPKPGPWTANNFAGQMDCGITTLNIPASPPENGVIEVLDDGQTVVGTGLQEDQTASITLSADPDIIGRYTGTLDGTEQGVPVTINYFWQVVTDEYIVGFLTATFTSEGVTCTVYRPYELTYTGDE